MSKQRSKPGTEVVPASNAVDGVEWGGRTIAAGFSVDLDAATIVDRMSEALLRHLRESLLTGERPDGAGEQAPLSARAAAIPGRQSQFRGYRTGVLADELHRSAIKSDGRTASCTVAPPPSRNAYLAGERRRGRELLTLRGAAGAAVAAAARAAVAEMVSGDEVAKNRGEVAAKDVEK